MKLSLARFFDCFYLKVLKPTKLPRYQHRWAELRKLGAARIVVGLIILSRTALSAFSAYYNYPHSTIFHISANFHFISSLAMVALLLCFTSGLFTPVSALLLLLSYPEWDRYMNTTTLATMILVHLLILFVLCNAGWNYSIDSLIVANAKSKLRPFVIKLYSILGLPSARQLSCYYFLAFAIYGFTSFGALTIHILDDYWRSGQTVEKLLTASFLCQHYSLMREVRDLNPAFFSDFSKFSVLGQSIYQLFMLVLVYNRLGYLFVLFWGLGFFVISLFGLELSFLAPMELVLWALVMFPTPKLLKTSATNRPSRPAGQNRRISGLVLAAFMAASFLFIFTFPSVQRACPAMQLPTPVTTLLYRIGLWCPNVFNKHDLAISDTWHVIYRCYKDGRREMVPFDRMDGSRGLYYIFDPLYYGNGLFWRRLTHLPDYDAVAYNQPGKLGYQLTEKVISFDAHLLGKRRPPFYTVMVYTTDPRFLPKGQEELPCMVCQYTCPAP